MSNTSPIMNLAVIEHLDLLKQLFEEVFIPEGVFQEVTALASAHPELEAVQALTWIKRRAVSNRPLVDVLLLELDLGEAEAIALALEMEADLLLVDERRGRRVARRLGLKFTGLVGMLVEAKHRGFIGSVKPVLDDLVARAGFWVSSWLYARVLQEVGE